MVELLLSGPKTSPTFFWDFRGGSVPPGASFTRGSAGWYFGSSGVFTQAATDVPRFDYDPMTLQPLGYLAEMQSTNAVTNSRALTGSGWAATGVTVTDNAVVSPDGTTSAATLLETTATSVHYNVWTATSVVTGSTYGISFFAKNLTGSRWVQYSFGAGYLNFDPVNGTIGDTSISLGSLSAITARNVGNGWWRFSFQLTAGGTSGYGFGIGLVSASNSGKEPTRVGDGTSTVALWGFQHETAGVGVTSYIPTSGATVTRSQDILSLPLTSLPGWNASRGGVLVSEFYLPTYNPAIPGFHQPALNITDGSNNFVRLLGLNGGGSTSRMDMYSGGVSQATVDAGAVPPLFSRTKVAVGWSPSRVAISRDGTLGGASSGSFLLPVSPIALEFGRWSGHSNIIISRAWYYSGARPDAFVQGVSR